MTQQARELTAKFLDLRDQVKESMGGEGPKYRTFMKAGAATLNVSSKLMGKSIMDTATLVAQDCASQGKENEARILLAAAVEMLEQAHGVKDV